MLLREWKRVNGKSTKKCSKYSILYQFLNLKKVYADNFKKQAEGYN